MSAWEDVLGREPRRDFAMGYLLQGDPCPTGVGALDRALGGGLYPGVTTLGGEPGSFKTGAAVAMFCHWALAGLRPCYVTLELAAQDVLTRMCSVYAVTRGLAAFPWATARPMAHAPAHDGRSEYEWAMRYYEANAATDPVLAAWDAMEREAGGRYAVLEDARELADVCEVIGQMGEDGHRGPVVVDYAQLVEADGASEYERMTEVSRELSKAARAASVPVLLISSLKKLSQQDRADGPSVNWFRGSGYLGYDATAAVIVGQPEDAAEGNGVTESTWHVVKNRHGRVADVVVRSQPWTGWIG